MPAGMSVRSRKIVITHPHAQIRQSHLAHGHDLILTVVQLVHVTLLLRQVLDGSQQLPLFPTVLLTLGKLAIAGVVGFPLALPELLDLGIGSGLLLFDRCAQQPVVYPLL